MKYEEVGGRVRNWRQGQRFDRRDRRQHPIWSILRRVSRRSWFCPGALEADGFHPFEWVPDFEVLVAAKAKKESVGAESDVVAHHGGIHADEFDREGGDNKFHFDCDSAADDLDNS